MANRMVTKGYQKGVYDRVTNGIEGFLGGYRRLSHMICLV